MLHDLALGYHWIAVHIVDPAEAAAPVVTKIVLLVVGVVCLGVIYLILENKIDKVTVKGASAKFLATLIGILFYAALWFSTDILTINVFTVLVIPGAAVAGLGYYGWRIYTDWEGELEKVLGESIWMTAIVGCVLVAGVSFSLAQIL